jgi:acyl-CoA thioester hydrolase
MPKPDPALLEAARYPFTCRMEPRFGDLDVNLHINNVAMASMLEDAHVRLHRAAGYHHGESAPTLMVASIAIEYLGQARYPDPLEVHIAIEQLGRTSHTLLKLATQNGEPVAFSRTVMVAVAADGPVPMPASFSEQATRWTLRP